MKANFTQQDVREAMLVYLRYHQARRKGEGVREAYVAWRRVANQYLFSQVFEEDVRSALGYN